MHIPRSGRMAAAAAAALPLAASLLAAPAQAAGSYDEYVALGDSFASGPGIPRQVSASCQRSNRNYAHLLAEKVKARKFVDVTCGAAVTRDLTSAQRPGVPPQFDALSAETDLVTLTIGGNDSGMLAALARCGVLSIVDRQGDPCRRYFTSGGVDRVEQQIAATGPKIDAALRGIRARAPQAVIVVTGYLRVVPDSGGCWPALPLAAGDLPWAAARQASLNTLIQNRAAAHGALTVNPTRPSEGRDACRTRAVRWTEPFTSTASRLHPNARGMAAMTTFITTALDG